MDPSWASQSFNMLGVLTGVLLLIFAAAWLLRRLQQSQGGGRGHLRVVSVLPLSAKERVVLVQAGEEQVLMGVSGAGIQHLHTLNLFDDYTNINTTQAKVAATTRWQNNNLGKTSILHHGCCYA